MNIEVGAEIPPISYTPSRLQLFRFSAVTWNAHRVHYDQPYARSEGYADIVVQSTLRGEQMLNVVRSWLADNGDIRAFEWRNLQPAYPEQTVTCRGAVVAHEDDILRVELEAWDANGELIGSGCASVALSPTGR